MEPISYILTRHSQNTEVGPVVTITCHREADGMLVAVVQNAEVMFGEDPAAAERRSFISQAHGLEYIKSRLRRFYHDGEVVGEIDFKMVDAADQASRLVVPRPGSRLRQ